MLKDGSVRRGLRTAAGRWRTLAVGMAAGAGEYVIGIVAAVVILVSLWPINAIADRLHGSSHPESQLRLAMKSVDLLGHVSAILVRSKLEIGQIATQRVAKENYQVDVAVRGRSATVIASAIEEISRIPGVDIVSTTQAD